MIDEIHKLPEDISFLISTYIGKPQPPELMRELRDYNVLYNTYSIKYGKSISCTIMAIDIFIFASRMMTDNNNMYTHNLYDILMRDPRQHTQDDAYEHMAKVYREKNARTSFMIFWGLMTHIERNSFATYSAFAITQRASNTI